VSPHEQRAFAEILAIILGAFAGLGAVIALAGVVLGAVVVSK